MDDVNAAICTTEFILIGRPNLDGARLIDSLNNSHVSSLTLLQPAMKRWRWEQPKFADAASIIVPKKEILLAIPMETQEDLQQRSQQRLYAYQTKKACRVLISVPPYQVIGCMNLNRGTTPNDTLIGRTETFLAITQVESIMHENSPLPTTHVVIVNCDRVSFLVVAGS